MAAAESKAHIKFLYVFRPQRRMQGLEISMLTDDNSYFEYNLELRSTKLTKYVGRRIRSLFQPFLLDSKTDVIVNPLLDESHLFYQYLMFVRQHVGFRLSTATTDRIVSRVHYFFKRKPAKACQFKKVWNETIESEACPWITKNVEFQLQNKSETLAQRTRRTRLAMFYLVVKNFMMK